MPVTKKALDPGNRVRRWLNMPPVQDSATEMVTPLMMSNWWTLLTMSSVF